MYFACYILFTHSTCWVNLSFDSALFVKGACLFVWSALTLCACERWLVFYLVCSSLLSVCKEIAYFPPVKWVNRKRTATINQSSSNMVIISCFSARSLSLFVFMCTFETQDERIKRHKSYSIELFCALFASKRCLRTCGARASNRHSTAHTNQTKISCNKRTSFIRVHSSFECILITSFEHFYESLCFFSTLYFFRQSFFVVVVAWSCARCFFCVYLFCRHQCLML